MESQFASGSLHDGLLVDPLSWSSIDSKQVAAVLTVSSVNERDLWFVEKVADHLFHGALTYELGVLDLTVFVVGAENHVVSREFRGITVVRGARGAVPLMDEDRAYFGEGRVGIERRGSRG